MNDKKILASVTNANGLFCFQRPEKGIPYWFCVRGNIPGAIGSVNSNMVVPCIYGTALTKVAISEGADASIFAVKSKEDKAKKSPRKAKATSKKKYKILLSLSS